MDGYNVTLLCAYRLIADSIVITHRHIHALTSQTLFFGFSGAIVALDGTNLRTFILHQVTYISIIRQKFTKCQKKKIIYTK